MAEDITIDERVDDLESAIKNLYKAFPEGDVEGHRRAHESMIQDVQVRKDLAKAIKEKTISGLVWMAIVGLGMAMWHEFLRIVGMPKP